MPIATNHSVIMEESHQKSAIYPDEEPIIIPPRLDLSFLGEIKEMFDKAKLYQQEEEACKRKIEQVEQGLEVAKDMLSKAQAKRDALVQRNEFLMGRLESRNERVKKAVQYWKNYGLDVKQVSNKSDPFEEYEFKFTKLPQKRVEKTMSAPTQDQQQPSSSSTTSTNNVLHQQQKSNTCSVSLKHQDKTLEISQLTPEILTPEDLSELNTRLTANCVNPDNGLVDYKLAMIMIRKDLIRSLNSCPAKTAAPSENGSKTCEHQPAETSSHTCT